MEQFSIPKIYKISAYFFITACILYVVYIMNDLISPLIISLLYAILLRPSVSYMTDKLKFPNIIAVSISVFFSLTLLASLIIVLGYQISNFIDDLPAIKTQLERHYHYIQDWIEKTLGYSYSEQKLYLEESVSGKDFFSFSSISSFTNSLMYIVLIPIYTFLILIYRSLLLNFIIQLNPNKNVINIQQVLIDIKSVVRSYIMGLLIQVACISFMTGIGYYFIGIKYFVFLGILTGLLNLIPYIGIIIAGVISCLIALTTTEDFSIIVWIFGVNVVVQFIDNNILVPKVVGSKVSINALASMLGVIIGGTIAGIPGMFLAIPVLAILKVIFESTEDLKPFGYLISNEETSNFNWKKLILLYKKKIENITEDKDVIEQEDQPNDKENV